MSIQIPIIDQERRLNPVAQSYVDPIIVKDDRGEALRGFGQALGEMASSARKRPSGVTNDPPADPSLYDSATRDDTNLGQAMRSATADDSATRDDADLGRAMRLSSTADPGLGPVYWQNLEDGKSQAASAIARLHAFGDPYIDNAASTAGPGAPDFTPTAVGHVDTFIDAQKNSLPNPAARAAFDAYAPVYRQNFIDRALRFEAAQKLQYRAEQFSATAQTLNQVVSRDPSQFQMALAILDHTLPHLDGGAGDALYQNVRTGLIQSAAGTALQRDPQALGDTIARAEQGENVASPLVRAMNPEERVHYQSLAVAEVFNQQSAYRENLNTRDADAKSSYMATGAANNPPTLPEFVLAFGEEEGQKRYQALGDAASAGQINQQVKTLPAADLARIRGDAQAKLGNPDDPLYPGRLRNAQIVDHVVTQIEQARQADPMGYALQNNAYGLAQIDFKKPESLAASLAQRVRAAQSVAYDYGTQPTALSNDEAKQMVQAIKAQPIAGQQALLKQIVHGIDNAPLAQVTMRMISANEPVIALAGWHAIEQQRDGTAPDISANQEWGGSGEPDKVDVLLTGAAALHPARDNAKSLAMPTDSDMRGNYSALTGDLYAGQPGLQAMTYAGVRAAYAAKSLEAGDTSGTFNEARMREAVRLMTGIGTANSMGPDDAGNDNSEAPLTPEAQPGELTAAQHPNSATSDSTSGTPTGAVAIAPELGGTPAPSSSSSGASDQDNEEKKSRMGAPEARTVDKTRPAVSLSKSIIAEGKSGKQPDWNRIAPNGRPTVSDSDSQLNAYERAMGGQSLRVDDATDQKSAKAIKAFEIKSIRSDPVHESISDVAIRAVFPDLGKSEYEQFRLGTRWNDLPKKDSDFDSTPQSQLGLVADVIMGKGAKNLAKVLPGFDFQPLGYATHYGEKQFWHSMNPPGERTNADVLNLIIGQAREWYNGALVDGQGAWAFGKLGKLSHMIQDSFSASHVDRDGEYQINGFQSYDKQSGHEHGKADKIGEHGSWEKIPGSQRALSATIALLNMYKQRVPFDGPGGVGTFLRDWVYKFAPGAAERSAGGSLPEYGKPDLDVPPTIYYKNMKRK